MTGKRPDYAAVVYCNLIRQTHRDIPIILGGIEGSLRRLAHYDYWSDKLKRSILLDSQADLISYGMGERSIVEVADALNSGLSVRDLTFIDGTVYKRPRPILRTRSRFPRLPSCAKTSAVMQRASISSISTLIPLPPSA